MSNYVSSVNPRNSSLTLCFIRSILGTLCPEHLKYFRFCGRVLAKAFLDHHLLRCRLATHIYKLILGWPVVFSDLKELDLDCYSRLKELAEGDDEDFSGLFFTASADVLGMTTRVPLVQNGFDIAVDRDNLPEYIDSSFKHRIFGRYKEQLRAFILGFYDIIPEPLIALFDFMEFEELMVGTYVGGKTEEDERTVDYRSAHEQAKSNYNMLAVEEETSEVESIEEKLPSRTELPAEIGLEPGCAEVESEGAGLTTSVTDQSGSRAILADSSLEADIRTRNTSSTGSAPIIEAFAVEYEPTYEAVQIGDSPNEKCHLIRIKLGQCPTCGMETHRVSGLLKKKYHPLSSKYVFNGRCLICKPFNSDPLVFSASNTSVADINDESPVGLELMDATVQDTCDDETNSFTMILDDRGVEKEPDLATLFATSLNTQTVVCKYCLSNLFVPKSEVSFTCERCNKVTYSKEYEQVRINSNHFTFNNLSSHHTFHCHSCELKGTQNFYTGIFLKRLIYTTKR